MLREVINNIVVIIIIIVLRPGLFFCLCDIIMIGIIVYNNSSFKYLWGLLYNNTKISIEFSIVCKINGQTLQRKLCECNGSNLSLLLKGISQNIHS